MNKICPICGKMNRSDFCWNCNTQLGNQKNLSGFIGNSITLENNNSGGE